MHRWMLCRLRSAPQCPTGRRSIIALPDVLLLPPPGKPVGTALAGAGCACILCRSRLLGRKILRFWLPFLPCILAFFFSFRAYLLLEKSRTFPAAFSALAQRLRARHFHPRTGQFPGAAADRAAAAAYISVSAALSCGMLAPPFPFSEGSLWVTRSGISPAASRFSRTWQSFSRAWMKATSGAMSLARPSASAARAFSKFA